MKRASVILSILCHVPRQRTHRHPFLEFVGPEARIATVGSTAAVLTLTPGVDLQQVVRSPKRLTRARRILIELREEIQSFYRGCRLSRDLIELRNAIQTALLVVHAASLNPRSKGCHYVVEEA